MYLVDRWGVCVYGGRVFVFLFFEVRVGEEVGFEFVFVLLVWGLFCGENE